MENCIFCKIIKGEIPAKKVYEDKHCCAFYDIKPQAPTHILVIPYEHYAGVHQVPTDKMDIIVHVFTAVSSIVTQLNLTENGYRLIINFGKNSGQEVPHIHVHILAGRTMRWPPG